MSSHIAFFNFPAIGHVNPTLGVVEELVKRGHRVTCTVTDHFAPAVEAIGAEAVRYESVFGDFYRSPFTPEANAGEGMRCLDEATLLVQQVSPFYERNRPDVVVHDFMAWGRVSSVPRMTFRWSGAFLRTLRMSTSASRSVSPWRNSVTLRSWR